MNDRAGLIVRLGVACFWALGPAEAKVSAADLTVSLEYDAAPGCPDIADLKAVVIARLGRDPLTIAPRTTCWRESRRERTGCRDASNGVISTHGAPVTRPFRWPARIASI